MKKKLILILFAAITLLAFTDDAFARSRGHRGGHYHGSRSRFGFHFGLVIAPPPVYPVVVYPPRRVVYVEPAPVIVEREVIVQAPAPPQEIVVWIANDNGSRTQINLKRAMDGGYIGPRGEYYSTMPSEEQLQILYGIKNPKAKPSNFTVWITNDNGSQTPITLTPSGNGFIGPSNEFYPTMPTEDQLKAMYGLRTNTPAPDSVTVWIENSDGTKLPIVLQKAGDEYIGPKGEHYATVPSPQQLKMIYGAKVQKPDTGNTVVWLRNVDGSKVPITLQKDDSNGYIGPAGEKYTSLPSEEQLQLLYGATTDGGAGELDFEITKNDGSKTIVTLKKEGSEFVGPKGERYPTMPTEDQLKLIYGK